MMRKNLSRVESEVFQSVMRETIAGRPPMPARLIELTGNSRGAVFRAIDHLQQRKMVYQAYERGPILPKATRDGIPVRLMVILGDPEQDAKDVVDA